MNFLSNLFGAIQEFFGWSRQKDAQKNAADVKAAAKGQAEADAINKTNDAIQRQDTDEIRKELAE